MVKIANRTREIRPSGMKRGACGDVSYSDFISHLAARAVFLSRLTLSQAFVWNVGTLHVMLRENPISEDHEGEKYRCT